MSPYLLNPGLWLSREEVLGTLRLVSLTPIPSRLRRVVGRDSHDPTSSGPYRELVEYSLWQLHSLSSRRLSLELQYLITDSRRSPLLLHLDTTPGRPRGPSGTTAPRNRVLPGSSPWNLLTMYHTVIDSTGPLWTRGESRNLREDSTTTWFHRVFECPGSRREAYVGLNPILRCTDLSDTVSDRRFPITTLTEVPETIG